MAKRQNAHHHRGKSSKSRVATKSKKIGRGHFNARLRECCEMLDYLGIPYVKSSGEAEAMCAFLNKEGLVDACITQDGDCFLYGARVVYRNFTLNIKDPHIDCYSMDDIESTLGLNQRRLVALSLLLGCDYVPRGVPGVGKEGAMKMMNALQDIDILERFSDWHPGYLHQSVSERDVMRKALSVPGFPNQAVIAEFLVSKDKHPRKGMCWTRPNLTKIKVYNRAKLDWPDEYTEEKVVPMISCYDMNVIIKHGIHNCRRYLIPVEIVKTRVRQGEQCVEIHWKREDLFDDEDRPEFYTTIEKFEDFNAAFPDVVEKFMDAKRNKPKKKSKKSCKDAKQETEVQADIDSLTDAITGIQLTESNQRSTEPILTCTGSKNEISEGNSVLYSRGEEGVSVSQCQRKSRKHHPSNELLQNDLLPITDAIHPESRPVYVVRSGICETEWKMSVSKPPRHVSEYVQKIDQSKHAASGGFQTEINPDAGWNDDVFLPCQSKLDRRDTEYHSCKVMADDSTCILAHQDDKEECCSEDNVPSFDKHGTTKTRDKHFERQYYKTKETEVLPLCERLMRKRVLQKKKKKHSKNENMKEITVQLHSQLPQNYGQEFNRTSTQQVVEEEVLDKGEYKENDEKKRASCDVYLLQKNNASTATNTALILHEDFKGILNQAANTKECDMLGSIIPVVDDDGSRYDNLQGYCAKNSTNHLEKYNHRKGGHFLLSEVLEENVTQEVSTGKSHSVNDIIEDEKEESICNIQCRVEDGNSIDYSVLADETELGNFSDLNMSASIMNFVINSDIVNGIETKFSDGRCRTDETSNDDLQGQIQKDFPELFNSTLPPLLTGGDLVARTTESVESSQAVIACNNMRPEDTSTNRPSDETNTSAVNIHRIDLKSDVVSESILSTMKTSLCSEQIVTNSLFQAHGSRQLVDSPEPASLADRLKHRLGKCDNIKTLNTMVSMKI